MFNLVVVLILTFIVSGILIYFVAAHDRKRARDEAQRALKEDVQAELPTIDFREFQKMSQDILEGLKLEIYEITNVSAGEFVIRARSLNPITAVEYLAVGFHLPRSAELELARIMELSDQIVSERIGKGIVMTTGKINVAAVQTLPELAAMEFIDGDRLQVLKKEYSFKF